MRIRRWLPIIAVATAAVSLGASVLLWSDARTARSDNVHDICMSRNDERRVHRENLDDQIEQTKGLPEIVFEQLQITRKDSLDRFERRKAKLHPLDCG